MSSKQRPTQDVRNALDNLLDALGIEIGPMAEPAIEEVKARLDDVDVEMRRQEARARAALDAVQLTEPPDSLEDVLASVGVYQINFVPVGKEWACSIAFHDKIGQHLNAFAHGANRESAIRAAVKAARGDKS